MIVENENISIGSDYNKTFKSCKFQSFKTKDYVHCVFQNCTFPNNSEIGLEIMRDTNNTYETCEINIDGIIKKLYTMTNGTTSIINSVNAFLNKQNGIPTQIADIGRIKNSNSKLVEI